MNLSSENRRKLLDEVLRMATPELGSMFRLRDKNFCLLYSVDGFYPARRKSVFLRFNALSDTAQGPSLTVIDMTLAELIENFIPYDSRRHNLR